MIIVTIAGGVVSWKSSKQTFIVRSTMESKFMSLNKVGEKVEWLCNFIEDMPCCQKPMSTISIHYDN